MQADPTKSVDVATIMWQKEVEAGFGSMLAGGCAVGAGMTGGAVFALTAWLTLLGMWAGAGLTDRLLDGRAPAAAAHIPPVTMAP